MRNVPIDFRVDGDRGDPHLLQGPGDPNRDLTAVGYEHLLEHGGAVYLGGRCGVRRAGTLPAQLFCGPGRAIRGPTQQTITSRWEGVPPPSPGRAVPPGSAGLGRGAFSVNRVRVMLIELQIAFDRLRRAAAARRGRGEGRRGRGYDAGVDGSRRDRGGRGGGGGGGAVGDRAGAGDRDVLRPRVRRRSPHLRLLDRPREDGAGLRASPAGAADAGRRDRREPARRGLRSDARGRDPRGRRRRLDRPAPHRQGGRRDRRPRSLLQGVPGARRQGLRPAPLAQRRAGDRADPRRRGRRGPSPTPTGTSPRPPRSTS